MTGGYTFVGGGSTNLIALGTVDGKTFFADDTIGVWAISVKFCADRGMRIAAITSKAQWDLLLAAYDALKFTADHWIAARDSHKSRQFTWDGLTSQPNQTYGVWTNEHKINYQTCACINPDPIHRAIHFDLCTNVHRTLCETK
ncbi:Snaclec bitiscetin subunit alpha [Orchesella cincta]|uniref:Snaclec bitiscetin subunit alpha n=1 Tax=Orchesella cincta TaxID=48709 RepID=A0A1D2N9S7_ORCCI|nr:Snaclec bitiscetin subunit alpha [Orchesella cincta]